MKAVESPCVFVCTLDENDSCVGCGRLIREISGWAFMSEEERQQVVEDSARRLAEWGGSA